MPSLCELCKSALVSFVIADSDIPHHTSISELADSAKDCHLCFLVWDAFLYWKERRRSISQSPEVLSRPLPGKVSEYEPSYRVEAPVVVKDGFGFKFRKHQVSGGILCLKVVGEYESESADEEGFSARFWPLPVEVARRELVPVSRSPEPGYNTGSKEALENVPKWLLNCLDNHTMCGKLREDKMLPTRVLDVNTPSNPGKICLHITNLQSPKSPYITLSHCWGSVIPLRLEQANISSLQNGIALDSLPKTFQDAVQITRHLGIRFLWIDSLCIIQDSLEDWERESSKMGGVYEDSICNIAASAAQDGRVGCFFDRNPRLLQLCEALITPFLHSFNFDNTRNQVKGPAVREPTLCQLVPDDVWNEGVTYAVLNTRAWVAQERMLSPRTIHFGKKQIFWECHELNACEQFPNGPPTRLLSNRHCNFDVGYKHFVVDLAGHELQNEMAAVALTQNSKGHSDQIIKEGLAIWGRVIEAYTTCKLTQDTDKLIAISAVAKKISPLCRSVYLAGLWRKLLAYQLLWSTHTDDSPQRSSRPRSYCAPTWSWASVTTLCKSFNPIDTRRENFMIKILEADVKTKGDKMGTVLSGHLKLRCWLERVPSHSSGGITEYSDLDAELLTFTDSRGQSVTIEINVDDNTLPRTDNWYLMPIVDEPEIESRKRIIEPENRTIHGLILLKTEERDEFCRAGTFSAEEPHTEHFMVPKYVDGIESKDTEEYERIDRAARFRDLETRHDSYFSLEYRIVECIVQDADIQKGWVERVIRIV